MQGHYGRRTAMSLEPSEAAKDRPQRSSLRHSRRDGGVSFLCPSGLFSLNQRGSLSCASLARRRIPRHPTKEWRSVMHYVSVAVCAGILVASVASAPVSAQTTVKRSPEEMRASYDAHKGDFDYLLGDWEFTAESKEYGKFRGLWSAVRLEGGQILDEYRVLGDNGDTMYMTTSLRNYNRALDRWELVGLDAGNGIQDIGTGRRVGSEMQIEQKFGVTTDKPSLWKIRYYDIAPDRFFWSADRSTDGGKTWVSKHQTIEARRIGPPRSFGALATGKKSTQSTPQAADPISGNWGSDDQTFLELKL